MLIDQRILVEESNTCSGEFLIHSLLELYLRNGYKVVLVSAANPYAHNAAVLKKLGINLQQQIEQSNVHYMDVFGAPFDYNSFDNLPLSLSVPNTTTTSVPSKVK